MSEFKREERFIVIKRKNLRSIDERELHTWLQQNEIPTCECVVVESDWPEYEQVWKMIQNRVEGKAATHSDDGREVPEAVAYVDEHGTTVSVGRQGAWISGHDRAIPDCWDRLMTVAQHERIVAEKDAEISALHHLCDDRFNEIAELRAQPARQVGGGEIELFEGWFNDPNSADNNKQYTLCIEDMRQLARDIARSAWQARAALTPAAAVMPDRKPEREALTDHWRENYEAGEADGYNEALDDVARLNRRAIPAGLLEKIAGTGCDPDCCIAYWRNELRALLGKDGE